MQGGRGHWAVFYTSSNFYNNVFFFVGSATFSVIVLSLWIPDFSVLKVQLLLYICVYVCSICFFVFGSISSHGEG